VIPSDALLLGLRERFRAIGNKAKELNEQMVLRFAKDELEYALAALEFQVQVQALVESYAVAGEEFHQLAKDVTLANVSVLKLVGSPKDILNLKNAVTKLAVNCDSAAGFLDRAIMPVPKAVIMTLESRRQQIAPIEEFDAHLFTHLSKAIEELETGHYLAAAMIAGKTVAYVNDKLDGKTEEEKVENLIRLKLLDPMLKESFLKAYRKTGDFYSHALGAVPEPQEALGAVSAAVDVATKYLKSKWS
jgi:small nuclear ribonucleoprotein (snRNP)-like protein